MDITTVSEIYEDKEVVENGDGTFSCPVCGKGYKLRKPAQRHLDKRDCHSIQDIFGGTAYEEKAFMFYKNICAAKNSRARPSMSSFRKSNMYKNTVSYVVSCIVNEVDHGMMYSFLEEIVGMRFPNKIMKEGQDMKWVKEYRAFIHKHPEVSDSKEFFKQYKDVLKEDDDFLMSSIEKAKISMGFVERTPSLCRKVEAFPLGYRMQVLDILEAIDRSEW